MKPISVVFRRKCVLFLLGAAVFFAWSVSQFAAATTYCGIVCNTQCYELTRQGQKDIVTCYAHDRLGWDKTQAILAKHTGGAKPGGPHKMVPEQVNKKSPCDCGLSECGIISVSTTLVGNPADACPAGVSAVPRTQCALPE